MIRNLYLTFFVLLFCSNCLLAQSAPQSGGEADQTDFAPGFSFGYVSNSFKVIKTTNWQAPFFDPVANKYITAPLNSITTNALPGFAIGLSARYSLSDLLEIRTTPSLIFADRELIYGYQDNTTTTKQVQSTTVDIPLDFKLKAERTGNFRAYVIGGLKYSLAVGKGNSSDSNDLSPLDKQVKNVAGFASYEAGFGCDIYYEYFKLSPEIKLSNSIGNVLVPENQPYSNPISKLFLHTVTISLYFE
jgi:hypothetical protein